MELINVTQLQAGHTTALDVEGREHLVVVVKGSFRIPPAQDGKLRLHEEPLALIDSDVFEGEPGVTACLHESDYALRKHSCDVLLAGSAHAPQHRPSTSVQVALRVGPLSKSFRVTGDRHWSATAITLRSTPPEPFEVKRISYGTAFGGVDDSTPDATEAYLPNPVGRGFARRAPASWLDGRPLPNCEETSKSIADPAGDYRPMAFGPTGRSWAPRLRLSGSYDEAWLQQRFPFLPADFDERYFQAAPADQQIEIPQGPVPVVLSNLSAEGHCSFELPFFEAHVHVFPRRGGREDHVAKLDTIVLEPDAQRVTMSWRVCRPLRRDLFEIGQVQIGGRGREWWLVRDSQESSVSTGGALASAEKVSA